MKGGPSVEVLLDIALGDDDALASHAAEVLKTQVFLYDADTSRLVNAHQSVMRLPQSLAKLCQSRILYQNYLISMKK